jgi:hypothetical protein
MSIVMLYFAPELFYLAFRFSFVRCDVVKSYDSAAPHKRRIHLEVTLHPAVGVITVEKQIIELLAIENLQHAFLCVR